MKNVRLVTPFFREKLSRSLMSFVLILGIINPLLLVSPKNNYAQVLPDTPANRARGVVGCTQTTSGISCPRGGSSGYQGVTPEEIIMRGAVSVVQQVMNEYQRIRAERMEQAYQLNEAGNDYWNRGMLEEAAAQYRLALQYSPRDDVIADNLQRVEQRIEENRQMDIRLKQLKVSEQEIGKMLDDLASQWGASGVTPNDMDFTSYVSVPRDDSLRFVSLKEPLFSKGTRESAPVDLSFNEDRRQPVVDPRVVKGEMTAEEAATVRKQEMKVRAMTTLAAALVGQGKYDEAIEYLRVAGEINPDDLGIKKGIGYALYLRDKHSGNMETSPKAEYLLDALEYGQGNWQASIDYLKELHTKDPNNLFVRDALDFTEGMSGYYVDPGDLHIPTNRGALPPLSGEVKSLTEKGLSSIGSKQFEEAYGYFRQAHELSPDDYGIRSVMNFSEGLWAAQQAE